MWEVQVKWILADGNIRDGKFGPFSDRAHAEQVVLMAIQRGALAAQIEDDATTPRHVAEEVKAP